MENITRGIKKHSELVAVGVIIVIGIIGAVALYKPAVCVCPVCTEQKEAAMGNYVYQPVQSGTSLLAYLLGIFVFLGAVWVAQQLSEKYGIERRLAELGDRGRRMAQF